MNLNNITARFRQYPTIFFCAALSLITLVAIFVRGTGLSEARAELEQVARESARIDGNIKNAVDIEEHLTALQEITEEVASRLIIPAELARNLQYFYRLETESRVRITDLNQRGTASTPAEGEQSTYLPVRYEIAVEGQYLELLEFLHRIESGRHFARFNQLEIVRAQRTDSSAMRLAINLELLGRP